MKRSNPRLKHHSMGAVTVKLIVVSLMLTLGITVQAAEPLPPILLWPGGAPGQTETTDTEINRSPNDKVTRLTQISRPTITVYPAPSDQANGAAVLVCPGGGYSVLAYDLEGSEICTWLNSLGITAVLLKYRVPYGREKPFQDVQRAMGLVRLNAAKWNIDKNRLGIIGFSAGGHLAAMLSTHFETRTYARVDEADDLSCRPDFAMLIYPAYLVEDRHPESLAPELTVTANTPPTFLSQTENDQIHSECSLFYFLALKNAGVPAELNIYPGPGHGYGLRPNLHSVATRWPARAEEWMRDRGYLKKP